MKAQSTEQLQSFIIFILVGFLIGLLFDSFRILRKTFKTPDFITVIEDIIFWILTGLLVVLSIFKFNNGEIRSYIILGISIGTLIYMLVFSKSVVSILVSITTLIKSICTYIIKIIAYPIIIFKKILSHIISFFKKHTKKLENNCKKILKLKKKQNKSEFKKDFA